MNDTIENETEVEIVDGPREYTIPEYRREAFQHKVDLANNRMLRGGLESEAFTVSYEPFSVTKTVGAMELPDGTKFGGTAVTEPWLRVTLTGGQVTLGNFQFVASLVAEEAGYTVHCAPGENLNGWQRPAVDDIHCDHCGISRNRKRLYIIRDLETNELLQVGHSCIELYAGLSPKGLWALTYDEELAKVAREDDGQSFSAASYAIPVDKVLAYAFAFSNEGKSYISTKAAEWSENKATGHVVREWIIDPPQYPKLYGKADRHYYEMVARWEAELEMAKRGDEYARDTELIADIKKVAETLGTGTDYADNMATILAGEHVSGRNVGILASLVSVYAREKGLAVERARRVPPAAGFLAPESERIRSEIRLTLRTVREHEGQFGWTTWFVGYTPDNHCVVWNASGRHDADVGDTLVLSAATVKKHENYKGTDQTVITRAKIKEVINGE